MRVFDSCSADSCRKRAARVMQMDTALRGIATTATAIISVRMRQRGTGMVGAPRGCNVPHWTLPGTGRASQLPLWNTKRACSVALTVPRPALHSPSLAHGATLRRAHARPTVEGPCSGSCVSYSVIYAVLWTCIKTKCPVAKCGARPGTFRYERGPACDGLPDGGRNRISGRGAADVKRRILSSGRRRARGITGGVGHQEPRAREAAAANVNRAGNAVVAGRDPPRRVRVRPSRRDREGDRVRPGRRGDTLRDCGASRRLPCAPRVLRHRVVPVGRRCARGAEVGPTRQGGDDLEDLRQGRSGRVARRSRVDDRVPTEHERV